MGLLHRIAMQGEKDIGPEVLTARSKAGLHTAADVQALRGGGAPEDIAKAIVGTLPMTPGQAVQAEIRHIFEVLFSMNNAGEAEPEQPPAPPGPNVMATTPWQGVRPHGDKAAASLREQEDAKKQRLIDELVDILDDAGPGATLKLLTFTGHLVWLFGGCNAGSQGLRPLSRYFDFKLTFHETNTSR